ncbi:MAG: hypothetical protein ACE5R6_19205 [Candidatus Heimdallarchaeota archaeon]
MPSENLEERDNVHDKKERIDTTLRFVLKAGQVRRLPKDIASAPSKIRLSQKILDQGNKAVRRANASGNEWGFFFHLSKQGQFLPSELKEGTPQVWISREEYLKAKKQDETLQGLLHTHPEAKTVFSESNIGFFLDAIDVIHICMDSQGDYFLILRTEKTPPPHEGLFEEAVNQYIDLARKETVTYVREHDLEHTKDSAEAINHGLFEAMKAVCKKYNIVLYIGRSRKAAEKVE